jgi:hypothetical protein
MIGLSRFRGDAAVPGMLAALLMVTSASVASCAACNGTACGSGVNVHFDGARAYTGTFDGGAFDGGAPADVIVIDIAAEMNQTFVTLTTCWLTTGEPRLLICESSDGRPFVLDGGGLHFPPGLLRVTMSENGNQISQEILSPTYLTQPCACGAATSTVGTARVELPPP